MSATGLLQGASDNLTGLAAQPVRIPASEHNIQQAQICERADAIIRKLQKAGFEACFFISLIS